MRQGFPDGCASASALGWVGRSPTGLGPCASYMMTGEWPTPQAQAYWQATQAGQAPYPYYGGSWPVTPPAFAGAPFPGAGFGPGLSKEQELEMLRDQADMLKQQIEQINSRIDELGEGASE